MARKKTTLMLDEGLYDQIRLRAAERRMSVSDVVAEAVMRYLPEPTREPRPRVVLPVAPKGTMRPFPPHVNLDSATAIEEYLDELEAEERKAQGAA